MGTLDLPRMRRPVTRSKGAPTDASLSDFARPVIWAIEAFPESDQMYLKTASALRMVTLFSQILPVYVLSEESFTERGFSTFLKPALRPMAKKAIQNLLGEVTDVLGENSVIEPRILVEPSASRAACARKLLRFAEKIGAARVAVGHHCRRGIARFFTDSFAESLLSQCRIPVLTTGPHSSIAPPAKADEGVNTIVFPTDFSAACEDAFDEILSLSAALNAELHLFHKNIQSVDTYMQSGMGMFGGSWTNIDSFFENDGDNGRSLARRWLEEAKERGVKTEFVSENFREPAAEAIVQYLGRFEPASTLVAMVPHTGPIASAFLGSVTRDVIRESPCPVYVLPRVS